MNLYDPFYFNHHSCHNQVPHEFIAGDSLTMVLSYKDYDALDGWTPTFYLQGPTTLTFQGQASGSAYSFVIGSSKTQNLAPATYGFAVALQLNDVRHTVQQGFIEIRSNVATAVSKITHVEKMLRTIEARLEGRFTDDVQSTSIAGRSVTNIPIQELMEYRVIYARELHVLKYGVSAGRKVSKYVFRPIV